VTTSGEFQIKKPMGILVKEGLRAVKAHFSVCSVEYWGFVKREVCGKTTKKL